MLTGYGFSQYIKQYIMELNKYVPLNGEGRDLLLAPAGEIATVGDISQYLASTSGRSTKQCVTKGWLKESGRVSGSYDLTINNDSSYTTNQLVKLEDLDFSGAGINFTATFHFSGTFSLKESTNLQITPLFIYTNANGTIEVPGSEQEIWVDFTKNSSTRGTWNSTTTYPDLRSGTGQNTPYLKKIRLQCYGGQIGANDGTVNSNNARFRGSYVGGGNVVSQLEFNMEDYTTSTYPRLTEGLHLDFEIYTEIAN